MTVYLCIIKNPLVQNQNQNNGWGQNNPGE
jgi:hypothetical protein